MTLIRKIFRYSSFTILTLFVMSIFISNVLPDVAGASILAVIVIFGARAFLCGNIAKFFIQFEGQYKVGDIKEFDHTKASGKGEEFGLRSTKIRAFSGEIVYIPNSSLTGVTKYVSGQQHFTIEVQIKAEEAEKRILEEIKEAHGLYLATSRLVTRNETPDGRSRFRLSASVLPSTTWVIEENLTQHTKSAAGDDSLAVEPLVYKVEDRNIRT